MSELSAARSAELLAQVGVDTGGAVATALGRGHIHRTYLVRCAAGPIVLQQINRSVFPDLEALGANTDRVLQALDAAAARGEYVLERPQLLRAAHGAASFVVDGEAWRAQRYIDGGYALACIDSPRRAQQGAAAFGQFCAALADLDTTSVVELLPRFHDLGARLDQLEQALGRDTARRLAGSRPEVDACLAQRGLVARIAAAQHHLQRHVCHNDTKIDNVLFDERDHRPRAVIDLDTCMPGWWMHDLGDIVRTFCSPETEDSTRLEHVTIRTDVFAAVAEGFTAALGERLSAEERESLWLGALGVCLTVAVRFLTDHLDGDGYFGAARSGHNVDRARNQLALYRDLCRRENELRPMLIKL